MRDNVKMANWTNRYLGNLGSVLVEVQAVALMRNRYADYP